MVVANYKSFEADDLHMATLSTEEAESLALVPDAGVTDVVNPIVRQRTNRNRFISVVSLILAIVGVTLLVSFSTGSNSKTTSSNTDLHSFDSISSGTDMWSRLLYVLSLLAAYIMAFTLQTSIFNSIIAKLSNQNLNPLYLVPFIHTDATVKITNLSKVGKSNSNLDLNAWDCHRLFVLKLITLQCTMNTQVFQQRCLPRRDRERHQVKWHCRQIL